MLEWIKKKIATWREVPYLNVRIRMQKNEDGGTGAKIDADFNAEFIHRLDQMYSKNVRDWNNLINDGEKVALWLGDILNAITEPHRPKQPHPDFEDFESLDNIPAMGWRGGEDATTTVDLSKIDQPGGPSRYGMMRG